MYYIEITCAVILGCAICSFIATLVKGMKYIEFGELIKASLFVVCFLVPCSLFMLMNFESLSKATLTSCIPQQIQGMSLLIIPVMSTIIYSVIMFVFKTEELKYIEL